MAGRLYIEACQMIIDRGGKPMRGNNSIVICGRTVDGKERFAVTMVHDTNSLVGRGAVFVQQAEKLFFHTEVPWFSTLNRAKTYAGILPEEMRDRGVECEDGRLIIMLDRCGVIELDKNGKIKPGQEAKIVRRPYPVGK